MSSTLRAAFCLGLSLLCINSAPRVLADRHSAVQVDHVIRGWVTDPQQLRPEDGTLMLGRRDGDGFSSQPIRVGPDGSFVTPPLGPATYVFEIVRTPNSHTKPATVVGLALVTLGISDVSGVTIEVRRDTAITGSFLMESDNPQAAWPPHIVVNAFLALDGMPFLNGAGAEGAAGGKFVLRNAFGPRVLRCGYTLAPGSSWWPSRVVLDGVDVTNVPTDFSAHENGHLEVVFTQHPARITGTVDDAEGRPVRAPWILVSSADLALRQQWSTAAYVVQGNTRGEFSVAVAPGRYVVDALQQSAFPSYQAARKDLLRSRAGSVPVEVNGREAKEVRVTVTDQ